MFGVDKWTTPRKIHAARAKRAGIKTPEKDDKMHHLTLQGSPSMRVLSRAQGPVLSPRSYLGGLPWGVTTP